MPELTLSPGESTKIVSQPGPNEAYQLDVINGDVFLSHNPNRTKAEGKLITAGGSGDLRNFRGKSIFAVAPDGATIRINKQSFSLNLFPREVIKRPIDKAKSEDTLAGVSATGTIAAGATAQAIPSISHDGVAEIRTITLSWRNGNNPSDSDAVEVLLEFEVAGSWETFEAYTAGSLPVSPESVAAEVTDFRVTVHNGSSASVDYRAALRYNTI